MRKRRILHVLSIGLLAAAPIQALEPLRELSDLKALEERVGSVAERVMPATVALISEDAGATGSGVVTSADGLILTAAHVIDGAESVLVVFPDGKQVRGEVLGANYSKDIGMVRIDGEGPWPFVELGESRSLDAGDWVVAMGHSEGYDAARTPPVRFGRVVSDGPANFLTTDCELIGGDSGGPLFDLDGRLVGINSSIGEALDNNNHAGIDGFREDWERLLAGESWGELRLNPMANPERVVLGISFDRSRTRRDGAVEILRVLPSTPAAKAGLRAGDLVLSVDSQRVDGGRGLQILLAKYQGGDEVNLGIERNGSLFEVAVELIRMDQLEEYLNR